MSESSEEKDNSSSGTKRSNAPCAASRLANESSIRDLVACTSMLWDVGPGPENPFCAPLRWYSASFTVASACRALLILRQRLLREVQRTTQCCGKSFPSIMMSTTADFFPMWSMNLQRLWRLCVPFVMLRRFPLCHPLLRNALSLLPSVGGFLRRWHGCAVTNPPSSVSWLRSSASSSGRQGRKMRQLMMMVDGRYGVAAVAMLLLLCWMSWIT